MLEAIIGVELMTLRYNKPSRRSLVSLGPHFGTFVDVVHALYLVSNIDQTGTTADAPRPTYVHLSPRKFKSDASFPACDSSKKVRGPSIKLVRV